MVISGVVLFLVAGSPNCLFVWACYEAGLFLFLGVVIKSSLASPVSHYYLIQSVGSALFMLGYLSASPALVAVGLTSKLGVGPLHFWVPAIALKLDWAGLLLMLVWQKFFPLLSLLFLPGVSKAYLVGVGISSALVGAVGGLGFSSPQLVLSFSSISHLGWVMVMCSFSPSLAGVYFLAYSVTLSSLAFLLKSEPPHAKFWGVSSLLLLALAGVPPFPVFTVKALAVSLLLGASSVIVVVILSISSLISLGYYVKLLLVSYSDRPEGAYGVLWLSAFIVLGGGLSLGLLVAMS